MGYVVAGRAWQRHAELSAASGIREAITVSPFRVEVANPIPMLRHRAQFAFARRPRRLVRVLWMRVERCRVAMPTVLGILPGMAIINGSGDLDVGTLDRAFWLSRRVDRCRSGAVMY